MNEYGKYGVQGDAATVLERRKRLEQLTREYQIAVETQLIVADRLAECARREGVNKWVNCRDLMLRYNDLINDRLHGMIKPPDAPEINRKRVLGGSSDP